MTDNNSQYSNFEPTAVAPIVVGDRLYGFYDWFETKPSPYLGQCGVNFENYLQNKAAAFFSLVKLGVGVIPEHPIRNSDGELLPDWYAFYRTPGVAYHDVTNVFWKLDEVHPDILPLLASGYSGPISLVPAAELQPLVAETMDITGLAQKLRDLPNKDL